MPTRRYAKARTGVPPPPGGGRRRVAESALNGEMEYDVTLLCLPLLTSFPLDPGAPLRKPRTEDDAPQGGIRATKLKRHGIPGRGLPGRGLPVMRCPRNEAPAAWGAHHAAPARRPPVMRTLGLRRGGRAALRAVLSLAGRPSRTSAREDVSRETSAAPPRGWPAAAPLSLCRPEPFQLRRSQPTLRPRHASSRPPRVACGRAAPALARRVLRMRRPASPAAGAAALLRGWAPPVN